MSLKIGMYYNNKDVRVQEMPVPKAGASDVLIKVMSSGICGSDIMEWYRIKRAPLVLGHEIAGEVVEAGKDVKGFRAGDRVFATHHVPCGACHYCLRGSETACETFHKTNNFDPGGFSEYLRVTGRSVETGMLKLPEGMTYDQGSFIEPLGTAVRGLRASGLRPGGSLLVLGSGIAGLLIIKLARALGAGRIMATDINTFRLEAAKKYGAEAAFDAAADVPELVRKANGGMLADTVMICNGALASSLQAMECVERGGAIVFFAVPKPGETVGIDFNPFWRNDVSIRTCYGAAPLDNAQAMELIRAGLVTVSDMVTDRFSLDDIAKGFQTASGAKESLKVIIRPHG